MAEGLFSQLFGRSKSNNGSTMRSPTGKKIIILSKQKLLTPQGLLDLGWSHFDLDGEQGIRGAIHVYRSPIDRLKPVFLVFTPEVVYAIAKRNGLSISEEEVKGIFDASLSHLSKPEHIEGTVVVGELLDTKTFRINLQALSYLAINDVDIINDMVDRVSCLVAYRGASSN